MSGLPVLAQGAMERVLNSIPEGLLIAAFAWLLLAILRKQNSGTRFAVWFLALLAIVAVPFVPRLIPGASVSVARATAPEITLTESWAAIIFAAWAVIAVMATARLAMGLWRLRELRRNGRAIPTAELHPALLETINQFRAKRQVAICSSTDVKVPTAIGFFRPVIFIPEWALRELPAEELGAVLLHEFAHLGRWDDWTNLLQKMVRTAFFFHPAVWWVEKRLSLEREMACDDLVLARTGNPQSYAKCLVSLAEKSLIRRGLAMTQAAISRAHETRLRLARILNMDPPKTSIGKPVLVTVAAFAAFCLVAMPDTPKLIAFHDPMAPYVITAENIAPALPQAAVVPAVARIDNARRPAVKHSAPKSAPVFSTQSQRIVARQTQVNARPAQLANAMPTRQIEPVQEFLVVMQTTDFDGYGSAVVNFTVWRVTFQTERPTKVRTEAVAKQT